MRCLPLPLALLLAGACAPDGPPPAAPTREEQEARFQSLLAAAAAVAPPAEPLRGELRITGRVVDEAARPVAGVLVRASRNADRSEWIQSPVFVEAPEPPWTLERSLLRYAESRRATLAAQRETISDAGGSFEIAGLPDGSYTVEAWCAGLAIEPIGTEWRNRIVVDAGASVEFVATPLVAFTLALRLPDGSSPELAALELRRHGSTNVESQTWTPQAPGVALPRGAWQIEAKRFEPRERGGGFAQPTHGSRRIDIVLDESWQRRELALELHGIPALRGTIEPTGTGGRPAIRVDLRRLAADEDEAAALAAPLERDTGTAPRVHHSERAGGRIDWQSGAIEPGRWLVTLRDRQRASIVARRIVEVADGAVRCDFAVATPEAPALAVRVLAPDGVSLRDCGFCVDAAPKRPDPGSRSPYARPVEGVRRLDGTYGIPTLAFSEWNVLIADHPSFGRIAREVPPGARELELRFAPPAAVALRLLDRERHLGAREVALRFEALDLPPGVHGDLAPERVAVPPDGPIELGRLQPGRWRATLSLVVVDARNQRARHDVATREWPLEPGPAVLELACPELHALEIALAAGRKVWLRVERIALTRADALAVARSAETDEQGRVLFSDLPAGLYRIRGNAGPESSDMIVEVPASGPVAFVDEGVDAQRVVLADPEGGLAQAGLATGDLVVAIAGREFRGRNALRAIVGAVRGEEVTLTIERGGERFEVVVPTAHLGDAKAAGGALVDASR